MKMQRHVATVLAGLLAIVAAAFPARAEDAAGQQRETGDEAREPDRGLLGVPRGIRIDWRVRNPFRFFSSHRDTEVHRATWISLTPEQRRTPVLSAERALGSRHPEGWAAAMEGRPCWNAARNLHQCQDAKPYAHPDSHRIVAELVDFPSAELHTCVWHANARTRGGRSVSLRQSCDKAIEVDVPFPVGMTLAVEVDGREVAEQDVRVRDIMVVGLGDSFGSGEGNPDVPVRFSRERSADYGKPDPKREIVAQLVGYPARVGNWRQIGDREFIANNARWLDQACHRSLYSHQLRTALQLSLEDPHRAVTYVGVACSGAEIVHGLFLRYRGNEWVPNPPELSQISAVAEAQCGAREAPMQDLPEAYHERGRIEALQGGLVLRKCQAEHARRIDLVLLSVGGNDIGFSRLVANAVLADDTNLRRLGGWMGQVHGEKEAYVALELLDDRYRSLKRALHNILHVPWNEADRVLLTAYPAMALLEDGRQVCPDSTSGMEVVPELRLSAEKAGESQRAAERLHRVMRASARELGWTFVERHRDQFLGRGICAGFTDNALTSVDDLRLPRKVNGDWEPYNPSDFQAYASRQRWFRTPNDAFLTGNFHATPGLLQSTLKLQTIQWFQLLLAATYSGAFHPTAEGHAAIADAALERARVVLQKYERRER
jgi:hypothetical protein